MTEQEKLNSRVKRKIAVQDANIKALVEELRDFKQEMRDRDNQRAAENKEIRKSIEEIYKTTDAKIAEIRNSVQSIQDSGRNQTIVTFLGIAAMVIAVLLK